MSGDCNRLSFQPTITIRQSVSALRVNRTEHDLCCYSVAPIFLLKFIVGPRATWPNSPHTLGAGRGPCSELSGTSPSRVRPLKSRGWWRESETRKSPAQLLSSRGDAIGTFPPIGCIGFPESELARARAARAVAARLAHLDLLEFLEFLAYGTSKACTS